MKEQVDRIADKQPEEEWMLVVKADTVVYAGLIRERIILRASGGHEDARMIAC
jgi:hypothetical protein